MNKKLLFAIILALLGNLVSAQVATLSTRDALAGVTGTRQLACSDNNKYVVVCSCHPSANSTNVFIVENMQTGNAMRFNLPSPANQMYHINDLSIANGICYFGGRHVTVQSNGNVFISEATSSTVGFFGYFSVADALEGSGRYHIQDVEGTDELTKISASPIDRQVFGIGYPKDCALNLQGQPSMTCLVDLEYAASAPSSDQWYYDVLTAPYDGEMLSDVSASASGITTVSRFTNNHYAIGLRYAKYGPFYEEYPWESINVLNVFDTRNMMASSQNCTWRENDDWIAIDGLCVAHVSRRPGNNTYGISLYQFNINHFYYDNVIDMTGAQFFPANPGIKMLSLANYTREDTYQTNSQYSSVLLEDSQNRYSVIKNTQWPANGSLLSNDYQTNSQTLRLLGLAPYDIGRRMYAIGYNPTDNSLLRNTHDTKMSMGDFCDRHLLGTKHSVAPLPRPSQGGNLEIFSPYHQKLLTTDSHTFNSAPVEKINECTSPESNF